LSLLVLRSPAAAGSPPPSLQNQAPSPQPLPLQRLTKILDNDYTFAVTYPVSSALQLAVSLLLLSTLFSCFATSPSESAPLSEHPTRMRTLHLRANSARRIPRSIATIARRFRPCREDSALSASRMNLRDAPGGRNLSSELTSLESTLIKVYQNKRVQLPLESTLTKNRGEGEYLFCQ
jgi:hypothetical protein